MNDYYVTRDEWLAAMLIEKAWWAKGIPHRTPEGDMEWGFYRPLEPRNARPPLVGLTTAEVVERVARGAVAIWPNDFAYTFSHVHTYSERMRRYSRALAKRRATWARKTALRSGEETE